MRRWAVWVFLLALLAAGAGCRPKSRRAPVFLVPPQLRVPPLKVAPFLELAPPPPTLLLPVDLATMPNPFPLPVLPPPPRRRIPASRPGPQPPDITESQGEPALETPAIPQLRPVLTEAERRRVLAAVDQNVALAEKYLASLAGRRLSPAQRAEGDRVRAILKQARDIRNTDPVQARSLAERAAILARYLASH